MKRNDSDAFREVSSPDAVAHKAQKFSNPSPIIAQGDASPRTKQEILPDGLILHKAIDAASPLTVAHPLSPKQEAFSVRPMTVPAAVSSSVQLPTVSSSDPVLDEHKRPYGPPRKDSSEIYYNPTVPVYTVTNGEHGEEIVLQTTKQVNDLLGSLKDGEAVVISGPGQTPALATNKGVSNSKGRW